MNMEGLQKMEGHPATPECTPSLSATVTAVNSPFTPQFPRSDIQADTHSAVSCPQLSDSDEDDEDGDDSEGEERDQKKEGQLPEDSVEGWPQLAQLMATTPEFAAFPRFRDLNVKSLLYYQCELNALRKELHRQEHADKSQRKHYAEYADILIDDGENSDQFKTIQKTRKLLKAYNAALLQYSQVCALPDPEPFNMRTLRRWLRNKDCGNFKIRDSQEKGAVNTWGRLRNNPDDDVGSIWSQLGKLFWGLVWMRQAPKSEHEPDLALTAPQTQVDGLTHWYASELIPFRRALKKERRERKERKVRKAADDIEHKADKKATKQAVVAAAPWAKKAKKEKTLESWSEDSALRLTSGISTVVACLLPVIAISVLSQLQGLKALLICLAAFSLVFAVGLIALTQGTSKRTEIFGATAAFSAVMVVFISIPPAPVIMLPPGSGIPSVSPSAVISALPTG